GPLARQRPPLSWDWGQRVAGRDLRAVLRRWEAYEAGSEPGRRFRQPYQRATDVAEVFVLPVLHPHAASAVSAGEGAHVAGDHHAVPWADAGLVARCPFEFAASALTDEQRRGRRSVSAHDLLVGYCHVHRDALGHW